ncbi:MAG: polysaccharide pyruvyl transferase family protein [Burkholderiales bacterium]
MKLFKYRGKAPNFGDELNEYLLPRVFPNFFDEDASQMFLAIGSILYDKHPIEPLKIVYGSGFGGYGEPAQLDASWKVYCLRGPRTAKALGLDQSHVAGDTAMLINRYRRPDMRKSAGSAFMPHWESLDRGDWANVCRLAGVTFIDPRWPVQTVLDLIESSDMVIAEAMHGAIVADALRVPWVPIMPFRQSHRYKWFDWAESLGIDLVARSLMPSTLAECWVLATQREGRRIANPGRLLLPAVNAANFALNHAAAARLRQLSRSTPMLSTDRALGAAIGRLEQKAADIRRDFA